ncbi:hypothetical protein GCK72_003015 [Caenorhabditis remanei]|uniref:F-box domain-containing protein n=1 Tax=Caenorhabditis remanei TaxID=31234 RepID=A0A6A5HTX9_CAERE|nr:hypothetical protein GCK72_003015 [Caenorhabditis remanei]KAF1771189.1 hypothetical protein GCK72_003015 [Caenorhabditis remanei]
MPPFPLLCLPRLVLCEVFRSLNIEEKIKLSICSKKISFQINDDRMYSQKVIANLDISKQEIRVHSENDEDAFRVSIHFDIGKRHHSNTQQCSIACRTVRVMSTRKKFKTFWKTYLEGFLFVIQHLLKTFQCKVSTSFNCRDSDAFQPTISMLFDLQVEFETLCIHFEGSKDENLLWNQISSNLGLVEYLTISFVPNIDFTPVFTSWPQNIWIMNSVWFTLESLLTCPCTTITLWNSNLENKDLDEIFRKWRAGGLPNLQRLAIISLSFEANGEQIFGMNMSELDGMVIKTDDDNGNHVLGRNLWELDEMVIETDDGSKKATIELGLLWMIEIYVTPFE